jgi:hypothetical protein
MDEEPFAQEAFRRIYVPISGDGPPVEIPESILWDRSIAICCPDTGERCEIEHGPDLADFAAGSWSYRCPSCGAEHQQSYRPSPDYDPTQRRRTIDLPFEVDLGELVEGQHIVTRGIELRTTSGSVLHYDFVPGFPESDRLLDTSWGLGEVHDDLESQYEHSGAGGWGAHPDGVVHWGDEDLGRGIPKEASWVEIDFYPAHSWVPSTEWVQRIRVDLRSGSVVDRVPGARA